MCRTAVLISGSGTNLQAFIDCQRGNNPRLDLAVVLSNRQDAYGLNRARDAGIETRCIDHRGFADRESFDRAMAAALDPVEPDLIVMAGFMRILSPWFVRRYEGQILNIHPALLPKYPGLHTHDRALQAGDRYHGSTVHFVTEELDGGPRILAGRLKINPGETADALQRRVQSIEHRIYPQAAQWYADGKIQYRNGQAYLDDELLREPVVNDYDDA